MLPDLEAPIHPKQKRQVLEAIRSVGLRVSPADVAAQTQIPVLVATQELNRIASETNAHLQVSSIGNISYVFDPRFEQVYGLNGTRNALRRLARISLNYLLLLAKLSFLAAFFVLRVSFGIFLVLSVVAVIVLLIVVAVRLLAGNGDGAGDGGSLDLGDSGVDLSGLADLSCGTVYDARPLWIYWALDWMWDWTYYGDYIWSPVHTYELSDTATIGTNPGSNKQEGRKRKSKFLDQCFTLLFGKDNPNRNIEELRWQEVARVIKLNNGAVVADQLAPYLEKRTNSDEQCEDWMLPVLLRFNGNPDVTESGHIIYMFPSFQQHIESASEAPGDRSNSKSPRTDISNDSSNSDALLALVSGHISRQRIINQNDTAKLKNSSCILETPWTMGEFETSDLVWIYSFASFAIAGSWLLTNQVHSIPLIHTLTPLLVAIFSYGTLFFIVPAIRYCINAQFNQEIDKRNIDRQTAAAHLVNPSKDLQLKIEEARTAGIQALTECESRVYTTEEGELEQRFGRLSSSS